MSHFILRIAVPVAIVLASCGFLFPKRYIAPKPGEPLATVRLAKPIRPAVIPVEPVQYFDVFDDASCAKGGHSGFLGALTAPVKGVLGKLNNNQPLEEYAVVPDKQLFLRARTVQTLDSRRRSLTTNNCTNLVSFTPTPGEHYVASQLYDDARCQLIVTDAKTGVAPVDLEFVPMSGECHAD
ncbi:hypothetical protein [Xanthomonas vesicatoria]|uniref:Lipoprotein n=1 Tax=Xanthomonas vesicatoria TaxID=56460 RepID=A0AAJ0J196_9XANT|nr:hypothetical protein [Xanthomonas vesicatoria]APO97035.1 hypothetical protein BI313_22785 [Xanthomonas vesicatoria]KHM93608.1 hypothetical protein OR60_13360 [Xanthomonas vesicatoria]KHM97560.1 hypothetical protein OR61_03600 [Xanthomonas vesicatoria]MCC8621195.1 hypothetical protein [Xanthomonas vesicatoria]MCC8695494.1 hypothetical protein [Xanthomonas vesicatoria]